MLQRIAIVVLVGVALGVLAYLSILSRGSDSELHNQRLQAMRELKQLDGQLNRAVLSARLGRNPESDVLVDLPKTIIKAEASLQSGPIALSGRTDAAVVAAWNKFRAAMKKKLHDISYYDIRNLSALRSIETVHKAAKILGDKVKESHPEFYELLLEATKETMEYALLPKPTNGDEVANMGYEITRKAATLGSELSYYAIHFGSSINKILSTREVTDKMMATILSAPTSTALVTLQAAYNDYQQKQVAQAATYRRILIGYAIVLLVVLAFVGWRLRNSYRDLNKANADLEESNRTLETRVQQRTQDLSKAYEALKHTQAQVVQSEKMASLGQMVAGVTHEINTPLGYVSSNFELVQGMFADLKELVGCYAEALGLIRSPNADETAVTQAFAKLAQTEAEVDHAMLDEAGQLLDDSTHGLAQISELVMNLKDFSRLDRSRLDAFDVNKGLDATLNILRHQLKGKVEVHKDYSGVPEVQCSPSQINQVFLNIITNAAQAIGEGGNIHLQTRRVDAGVQVKIRDDGSGMSAETIAKMYEPFYTTKGVGKGTGLGMSIVFQIMKEHGATMDCQSAQGEGTTFTLTFPLRQGKAVGAGPSSEPATQEA